MVVGRVAGFRGRTGEMSVRVASGRAERWTGLGRVEVELPDGTGRIQREVESARAYGATLVLKLAGVDDASAVEALRGGWIVAAPDDVPALPEGEYWVDRLCGLPVVDEATGLLGRVEEVEETGGVDLLRVVAPDGEEIHIPFAREIVTAVDEEGIRVRLPEGLRDLNRRRRPT